MWCTSIRNLLTLLHLLLHCREDRSDVFSKFLEKLLYLVRSYRLTNRSFVSIAFHKIKAIFLKFYKKSTICWCFYWMVVMFFSSINSKRFFYFLLPPNITCYFHWLWTGHLGLCVISSVASVRKCFHDTFAMYQSVHLKNNLMRSSKHFAIFDFCFFQNVVFAQLEA